MSATAEDPVRGAQPLRAGGRAGADSASACLHCGQPLFASDEDGFCCGGCRAVHRLLRSEGLDRYYDLRGRAGSPVPELRPESRDHKWLEAMEERVRGAQGVVHVSLDVQGIHCAACVWLMQALFDRRPGGVRALVNPAVGRVDLAVEGGFELGPFVRDVERFGYLLGPPLKGSEPRSDELLLRTGVCIALAMNAMLFAAALHLGLDEGPIYTLMHQLGYALATVSVVVGGSVFIQSAWQGVRQRVLHLDLPIAIGIVLAFGGSTWSFFFAEARATYFDSVAVFIALMLLGRFLQERVLEKNRRQLLASDGVDGLLARRVEDGAVALVPCRELAEGDELLVAPGDLIPVDGTLLDGSASCSLDWINGESTPRDFARGASVPAGAFNLGTRAIRLRAETAFDRSPLTELLRSPVRREDERWGTSDFWQRFAKVYVILVLAAAAGGFAAWLAATGDGVRAAEVATAILVVTCPCAFGIATPLAYELVQGGLRRAGLFVRSATFLDRARQVRQVVFDKTGTLTSGTLGLEEPAALGALEPADRQALYDLAARSAHPKSLAVKRALDRFELSIRPSVDVVEHPGLGLAAHIEGRTYRLGAGGWAADGPAAPGEPADLLFSREGRPLALLRTRETLRRDAAGEVARLREEGFDVWILSGDAPDKVRAMARTLGLPGDRAVGGQRPEDKARWLEAHDRRDTLMVGDGINDGLAVDRAFASGTPAVDRPFMPARSDFYLVTPGLRPVALALRASVALAQSIRRNVGFAAVYNAVAVAMALAGWMQPWLAAILMPASSLAVLAATSLSLSRRSALWSS